MWVRVFGWMLADDEPARPKVGGLLSSVGVRIRGAVTAADPSVPDGVVEAAGTGGSGPGEQGCALTGMASEAQDLWSAADPGGRREHYGAEFVLKVGIREFQVQFDGHASEVMPGARLTVTGCLELVGEYEWEAFGLRDTRTDWLVAEVVDLPKDDISVRIADPASGRE